MRGQRIRRHRLCRDQSDDRPSCRIRYSLKNISSHISIFDYAMIRLRMQAQSIDFVFLFKFVEMCRHFPGLEVVSATTIGAQAARLH